MLIFKAFSLASGLQIIRISDPEIAVQIMKQSSDKGRCLESKVSVPAWRPLLSLESVDGELWVEMKRNFEVLLKNVGDAGKMQAITLQRVRALISETKSSPSQEVDANFIAKFTLQVILEFLFGIQEWHSSYQTIVDASWEWRREISMRGKGDKRIQHQAIEVTVKIIRNSRLWSVFGDKWSQVEYYSLIIQPFFISPCINVGDILCALKIEKLKNKDVTLEAAMRLQHPFPLFERFISKDLSIQSKSGSSVSIKANTQVIMFTSDFVKAGGNNYPWPVFGAGPRVCRGAFLALPLLTTLVAELYPSPCVSSSSILGNQFKPELNHRYSGRHNDGKVEQASELMYFVKTVCLILYSASCENK
jgi:hypothetical protein